MWDIQKKEEMLKVISGLQDLTTKKKLTKTPEEDGRETVCQLCQESGDAH